MGNKRNKVRKTKCRAGQRFAEWRILKSYGLVKSRSEESELSRVLPVDPTSIVEQDAVPATFDCLQPVPEVPVTPMQEDFRYPETEEPSTPAPAFQELLTGRRIVDIEYLIRQFRDMSSHGEKFGCTLKNMIFQKELYHGLRSGFVFNCNMCSVKFTLWSEDESETAMDVNEAAVAAVMNAGGGYTMLSQIMSGIDVRCMNAKTYDRIHEKVSKGWEETALEEMKAAAAEEARLARERGDVDKYGVPLLTVVTDASWAKRSYRNNYNSLSGVAAIVGYHTKKVMHIGVKNKYCTSCARNAESGKSSPHACFKNYSESSGSMESSGIVDGFLSSMEMHGVKYATIIADGDSSVLQKINEVRPYDDTWVSKIECRNHLLRNYSNKIKDISKTPLRNPDLDRGSYCRLRKQVGTSTMRLRAAVTKAIAHRKNGTGDISSKAQLLRRDLLNGPCHVFGDHSRCDTYFCNGKKNEANMVPDLKKFGIYQQIMVAVQHLADRSRDLIHDVDSNIAEHYNAAVARLIGGKRVNFCLKQSYQARCAAAVVSFNSGKSHYRLHKTMYRSSPGKFSKMFEERRFNKIRLARLRRLKKPKLRRRLLSVDKIDEKSYGPLCNKPDIDAEVYAEKENDHWKRLLLSEDERNQIEQKTRYQSESDLWMEERRMRITASNFGLICNRKPYSNSAPVVNSLLYSFKKDCAATAYGRENETRALEQLAEHLGTQVKKCGLFIDEDLPFLAATPDGLIGDDAIVEVKCPYSGKNLTPEEVIQQKSGVVGTLFSVNKSGAIEMKKRHVYHFQIQGQLHITKRNYCVFVLWTPLGMKLTTVLRDDNFWETEMVNKLTIFYKSCLLPELLDPRRRRSMPLREPAYIEEAQKIRMESKKEKESLAQPLN